MQPKKPPPLMRGAPALRLERHDSWSRWRRFVFLLAPLAAGCQLAQLERAVHDDAYGSARDAGTPRARRESAVKSPSNIGWRGYGLEARAGVEPAFTDLQSGA